MNPIKLFRRHTKTLLMVFMSFLLVAFLLPSSMFSGRGAAGNQVLGTAYGQAVHSGDLRQASTMIDICRRLNVQVPRTLDALDVYLLLEEARRVGVRFGPGYAQDSLRQSLAMQGVPAEQLAQQAARVQNDYRISQEQMYQSVADWFSIQYVAGRQLDSIGDSLPRLEQAYRDQKQEAVMLTSVIMARSFIEYVGEPSEEELQRLFEEGKDRETAHTDDALVFGYRVPAKIRIEYLTVDPAENQERVRVRDSEAQRYFENNRQLYVTTREIPAPEGTDLPPTVEEIQQTYDEAKADVKRDLRAEKAIAEAQRLVNEIHREVDEPWLASARDEQGFRPAPPEDQIGSFDKLAEKYSSETYRVKYGKTEWVDQLSIRRVPNLGIARYVAGNQPVPLETFVFRVKGLFERPADDRGPVLVPYEPALVYDFPFDRETRQFSPNARQTFLIRVTDVQPAGPPASLDEVRARVVADWKLMKAFELAGERASEIAEAARQAGLSAAVEQAAELKEELTVLPLPLPDSSDVLPEEAESPQTGRNLTLLGPNESSGFTRNNPVIEQVGLVNALADKAFSAGDPASLALEQRILTSGVAKRQAWVVCELQEITPIYAGEFEAERGQLARSVQNDMIAVYQGWYDPENIRLRAQWAQAEDDRLR